MGILWTIIIGAVAGFLAKLIMPGRNEPQGFVLTTILGIIGAFVGTFLGRQFGIDSAANGVGIIGATIGAIIVLAIWGFVSRRRT